MKGSQEEILAWTENQDIAIPVLVDTEGSILSQYKVTTTPDIFILTSTGVVAYESGGGFLKVQALTPLAAAVAAGRSLDGIPLPAAGAG